jgi:hypothetical protein
MTDQLYPLVDSALRFLVAAVPSKSAVVQLAARRALVVVVAR